MESPLNCSRQSWETHTHTHTQVCAPVCKDSRSLVLQRHEKCCKESNCDSWLRWLCSALGPAHGRWGPVPTPLHAGAPGQRQIVSLLGWVRGDVRLVLSYAVMSMYVLKDDQEMFFRRQSSGTYDFWVFFYLSCFMQG